MIAIKGMEKMPETCSDCDYCHGHICKRTGIDIVANPKSNCPLIEIVTCKDCNNYVKGALDEEICLKGHELINKDFYCSDAKKRRKSIPHECCLWNDEYNCCQAGKVYCPDDNRCYMFD